MLDRRFVAVAVVDAHADVFPIRYADVYDPEHSIGVARDLSAGE